MKKTLTIFLLSLSAKAFSQPVTQANLPVAGDILVQFIDNFPATGSFSITPSGSGQTWNYAQSFVVDDTSGFQFTNASALPWNLAGLFPDANLGSYYTPDTSAVMFKTNSSGLYYVGAYRANPPAGEYSVVRFLRGNLILPTPLSFGFTGTHSYSVQRDTLVNVPPFGNVNARYRRTFVQNMQANASGTLITPAGTFTNTVRLRDLTYAFDSLFVLNPLTQQYTLSQASAGATDTSLTYRWFQPATPVLLCEMMCDPINENVVQASFYFNNVIPTGVHGLDLSAGLQVYPNPVTSAEPLNLILDAKQNAARVEVMDMMGRVLYSENVMGRNRIVLSTAGLAAGSYLYRVLDSGRVALGSGTFRVVE